MSLLLLALLAAADPADPPPAPTPAPAVKEVPWTQTVGTALVAAGAGLAAAGTATFTLIEALSTPDRFDAPITPAQQNLTQGAGFAVAAIASGGAVAIVVGAGMLLIDPEKQEATPSSSASDKRY